MMNKKRVYLIVLLLFLSSAESICASPFSVPLREGQYVAFGREAGSRMVWQLVQRTNDGQGFFVARDLLSIRPFSLHSNQYVDSDVRAWLRSSSGFMSRQRWTTYEKQRIRNVELISKASFERWSALPNFAKTAAPTVAAIHEFAAQPVRDPFEQLELTNAPNNLNRPTAGRTWRYWLTGSYPESMGLVHIIKDDGTISDQNVDAQDVGVRPVLQMKAGLNRYVSGGTGTRQAPFVMSSYRGIMSVKGTKITVDGISLKWPTDHRPTIILHRLFVPCRKLAAQLGMDTHWQSGTMQTNAQLYFRMDPLNLRYSGERRMAHGNTLICSVRDVAEQWGYQIKYH